MRNTGEICVDVCPEGCDRGCEVRATWTPIPGVPQYGLGPGVRFVVNAEGGGVLYAKAKGAGNFKINRRVGSVVPYSPHT